MLRHDLDVAHDSTALPQNASSGTSMESVEAERDRRRIMLEDGLVRSIAEMGPELDCMAVELGGFASLSTF